MARVTVEDCILNIPNRFELVVTASQRAKQIASGMPLTIDRDNDKDAVVALREIGEKTIDFSLVNEEIIGQFQKRYGFDPKDAIEDDAHGAMFSAVEGDMQAVYDEANSFLSDSQHNAGMSFVEENIEVED